MKECISREAALAALKTYNKEPFHILHGLTVEGVMRWYANELGYGEDADFWATVGLLHDIDFEMWPEQHCRKAPELLKKAGCSDEFIHAVCSHGYGLCCDVEPTHEMEKVLFAADELTGLVGAAARMRPSKSVMDMEVSSLKKKYKDKKNQQSQLAMQEEIKSVYDKYGTSPTGSCLQLIIQMPILFALYRVIMNVPAYVKPVKELYLNVLYGLDLSQMKEFFGLNKLAKNLSTADLNSCIDAMSGYTRGNSSIKLQSGIKLQDILNVSDKAVASKIDQFNNFFGLNLSMSPSTMFNAGMVTIVVALIIPILAGLFQLLSVQLTTKINSAAGSANMAANPMAGSMKAMNIMMPLMSVYMCWILSAGIGLYWMAGSLVMILQQIFINLVLKNEDIDEIIEKNKDKAAAKAAKRKEKEGIYREKVLEASKVNAKNISSNSGMSAAEKEEKIRKAKEAMSKKEGSLASKVNMVSEFNKRNEK